MGCVLSWCGDGERKEEKELKYKVQVLSRELTAAKTRNDKLQISLNTISKEARFYIKETERLTKIKIKYENVLTNESEQTAGIIMSSTLHLKYMDDPTEKKHIKDVLQASYDMVNC
jgi:transcription elongation GreA/GreB family factor